MNLITNKEKLIERMEKYREIKPSPDGRFPDCWWWTANKYDDGYGQIKFQKKAKRVHRISAMIWLNFDINSINQILHKCDNPLCFNPNHLFIGDHNENMRDKMKKGRANFLDPNLLPHSKIDSTKADEIRKLYKDGISMIDIGLRYGLKHQQISRIVRNKCWKKESYDVE